MQFAKKKKKKKNSVCIIDFKNTCKVPVLK